MNQSTDKSVLHLGTEKEHRPALTNVVEEIAVVVVHFEVSPAEAQGHLAADLIVDARDTLPREVRSERNAAHVSIKRHAPFPAERRIGPYSNERIEPGLFVRSVCASVGTLQLERGFEEVHAAARHK